LLDSPHYEGGIATLIGAAPFLEFEAGGPHRLRYLRQTEEMRQQPGWIVVLAL
jgi:hypothetical protein